MMTVAACLWLGLFPLLNGGSYAHITKDKWWIMMILCGVTLLCFCAEAAGRILREKRAKGINQKNSEGRIVREQSVGGIALEKRRGGPVPLRGVFWESPAFPVTLGLLLLIWMTVSCLVGPYGPETWLIGASVRREGLLTRASYLGLFTLFACSRVKPRLALTAAAVGVCAFFAIVMLQRGGGNPLGLFPRGRSFASNPEFQGTIGNTDMDAGYLCMMAGSFLYGAIDFLEKKRKGSTRPESLVDGKGCVRPESQAKAKGRMSAEGRTDGKREGESGKDWKEKACLILWGLGLVFSGWLIITMDVQFGLFTLIVLLLAALLHFLPGKARLSVLLLVIVLALALVWFWPGHEGTMWEAHEILHGRTRPSFGHNRAAVWFYSARLARERLIMGGGSDTFVYRFNEYLERNGYTIPTEQDGVPLPAYFDNPHNEYLAQLVDHGLPALILFAALIVITIFRRREGLRPALSPWTAGACCYAVQAFFSFSVCLVAPMFWVMMGIANGAQDRY